MGSASSSRSSVSTTAPPSQHQRRPSMPQPPPAAAAAAKPRSAQRSERRVSSEMTNVSGYPPPQPIRTRKADIFDIDEYAELDKYACATPDSLLAKSYTDVADYLTKNARSDLEKVRAIFRWIASLDLPVLQSRTTELPESGSPLDYLLKINWRMGNHANFMMHMARAAGLYCIVLNGINKSAAYQLGKPIDHRAMMAQWNAVYVDDQWRLLDVFWASTCLVGRHSADWALLDTDGELVDADNTQEEEEGETVHAINEFFFIPDPDHLIATHLPDDPLWQLLDTPVTFGEFEDGVYVRDRFFQLNLSIPDLHLKHGVQKTVGGHTVISLSTPAERSSKYDFRYLLFKSRQSTSESQIPYERFVMYRKKADVISYTARFPMTGRFKLDVFGLEIGRHDSYDLICSYLIDCTDADKQATLLPDCPDIGWGPGSYTEEASSFV